MMGGGEAKTFSTMVYRWLPSTIGVCPSSSSQGMVRTAEHHASKAWPSNVATTPDRIVSSFFGGGNEEVSPLWLSFTGDAPPHETHGQRPTRCTRHPPWCAVVSTYPNCSFAHEVDEEDERKKGVALVSIIGAARPSVAGDRGVVALESVSSSGVQEREAKRPGASTSTKSESGGAQEVEDEAASHSPSS